MIDFPKNCSYLMSHLRIRSRKTRSIAKVICFFGLWAEFCPNAHRINCFVFISILGFWWQEWFLLYQGQDNETKSNQLDFEIFQIVKCNNAQSIGSNYKDHQRHQNLQKTVQNWRASNCNQTNHFKWKYRWR